MGLLSSYLHVSHTNRVFLSVFIGLALFSAIFSKINSASSSEVYECEHLINVTDDCGYRCGELNNVIHFSEDPEKCENPDKTKFPYLMHHEVGDGNYQKTETSYGYDYECVEICPFKASPNKICYQNEEQYQGMKKQCKLQESHKLAGQNWNRSYRKLEFVITIIIIIIIIIIVKTKRTQLSPDEFEEMAKNIFYEVEDDSNEYIDRIIRFKGRLMQDFERDMIIGTIFGARDRIAKTGSAPEFLKFAYLNNRFKITCKGKNTLKWLICMIEHPNFSKMPLELFSLNEKLDYKIVSKFKFLNKRDKK